MTFGGVSSNEFVYHTYAHTSFWKLKLPDPKGALSNVFLKHEAPTQKNLVGLSAVKETPHITQLVCIRSKEMVKPSSVRCDLPMYDTRYSSVGLPERAPSVPALRFSPNAEWLAALMGLATGPIVVICKAISYVDHEEY